MASQNDSDFIAIKSAGFELYLPPTPMLNPQTNPPERPRFVMLDYTNDVFYDVDYETANLRNSTSYAALALHTVQDPAIVFPPNQWNMLQTMKFATGFLVSIISRDGQTFSAKNLGSVNVKPLRQELMNWAALRSKKGPELPAEMKAGLLRHVWNRRSNAATQSIPYVHQRHVLDNMSNPWHRDGVALNYELDQQFAGGRLFGAEQQWKLYAA